VFYILHVFTNHLFCEQWDLQIISVKSKSTCLFHINYEPRITTRLLKMESKEQMFREFASLGSFFDSHTCSWSCCTTETHIFNLIFCVLSSHVRTCMLNTCCRVRACVSVMCRWSCSCIFPVKVTGELQLTPCIFAEAE